MSLRLQLVYALDIFSKFCFIQQYIALCSKTSSTTTTQISDCQGTLADFDSLFKIHSTA